MAVATRRIHRQEKRDDEVQPAMAKGSNTIIVTRTKTAAQITVIFLLFLESGSTLTLGQDNYPKSVQSTVYVLKIAAN